MIINYKEKKKKSNAAAIFKQLNIIWNPNLWSLLIGHLKVKKKRHIKALNLQWYVGRMNRTDEWKTWSKGRSEVAAARRQHI